MIIVIDGADGTGKTTLANKLVEAFGGNVSAGTGVKYIHATWSRELDCRMLEYHMGILADAYKFTQETRLPAIIDRLWLSEAIYAEVYREGSKYPKEAVIMDKFIELIGGINIITLADDLQKHAERFNQLKADRVEMYENVTHVAKLYNQTWNPANMRWGVSWREGYLNDITQGGGLCKRKNYLRYSIETEGSDMEKFVDTVKWCFEKLNPYWGRK